MGRLKLLLTTANGNIVDCEEKIREAVEKAEKYAFEKLNIDWDIDLLVTNRLFNYLIPEDSVGGRTWSSDFIELAIDDQKVTEEAISEILTHELCHAARWGKNNEWTQMLLDEIIFEGIATYFEAEYAKTSGNKTFFLDTVTKRSDEENERILTQLSEQLNCKEYNHEAIFFRGNEKLLRWSGYSLGYYLVKRHLEKTGKSINEAYADEYSVYKDALEIE